MTKKRFPLGTIIMTLISVVYLSPLFIVLMNAFKLKTTISATPFVFPNADSFCGFDNYIRGMTYGDFPFWKSALYSLVITVLSTAVILLFTSMTAWFVSRVDNVVCKVIYYLCVFSMIVPFQMVMYTLSKTADTLHLSNYQRLSALRQRRVCQRTARAVFAAACQLPRAGARCAAARLFSLRLACAERNAPRARLHQCAHGAAQCLARLHAERGGARCDRAAHVSAQSHAAALPRERARLPRRQILRRHRDAASAHPRRGCPAVLPQISDPSDRSPKRRMRK